MWKYIRFFYKRKDSGGRLIRCLPMKGCSVPWIFGYLCTRLIIYQCLQLWVFKLSSNHIGFKVGEFWRTRYLVYAEKVLIKKRSQRNKKKFMGQRGYPNTHSMGLNNIWRNYVLGEKWNASYFFQMSLIESLGNWYFETCGGGYFSPIKFLEGYTWDDRDSLLMSHRTSYLFYRNIKLNKCSWVRTWILLHQGWMIICFLVLKRRLQPRYRYLYQAMLYLQCTLWDRVGVWASTVHKESLNTLEF